MKIGYADPPYIGCAHLYKDHPDYAGEVDHAALIDRLQSEYDGWVLHASATPHSMALLAPLVEKTGARWFTWVKGFAAFKRNVPVAYAWEPVIIKPARKPVVSKRLVMRDWIQESITLKRGLTGAKPEAVCHWAFECVAAHPEDALDDIYPGTGAVIESWRTWRLKFVLPDNGPLFISALPVGCKEVKLTDSQRASLRSTATHIPGIAPRHEAPTSQINPDSAAPLQGKEADHG